MVEDTKGSSRTVMFGGPSEWPWGSGNPEATVPRCLRAPDPFKAMRARQYPSAAILCLELEAHGEIDCPHMLRDAADRYEVDSGFGDFANSGGGDSAGGFQLERLLGRGVEGYRLAHGVERELVEHGDVGAGRDRLLQFRQIFDFDFHRDPGRALLGGGHRRGDRTGRHDVIFLDEV